ncbi:MAG: alpha-glucosidase C-terminal domain-containing protein [Lentimicrobiaceae bacterium]
MVRSTGDLNFMVADGKTLAYKRFDAQDEIIVLFNLESTHLNFTLLINSTWVDLLTNKQIKGTSLVLKPFTAAILKKSE